MFTFSVSTIGSRDNADYKRQKCQSSGLHFLMSVFHGLKMKTGQPFRSFSDDQSFKKEAAICSAPTDFVKQREMLGWPVR